jgi:hypothetical protein
MPNFICEYIPKMEDVRKHIQDCEGRHSQQVAFSSFHDCLTQICFGCRKIRTSMKAALPTNETDDAQRYREEECLPNL